MSKASRRPTRQQRGGRRQAHRGRAAWRPARARRRLWLGAGVAVAALAVALPLALGAHGGKTTSAGSGPALGSVAPDGTFSLQAGGTQSVSSLRGRPTLLWFVTTWCPSCQAGTRALATRIGDLARSGVRVVELELAGNLGQAGPNLDSFSHQFAGSAGSGPNWTFGVASAGLTRTYDPANYLDIYYLIDSSGRIRYVNSSPASTMGDLLAVAAHIA